MSTSVLEYIAVNVLASINAITIENGYNQILVGVRPNRDDFESIAPENGTVLIVEAPAERPEIQMDGAEEWLQPFVCMAYVIVSDGAAGSVETKYAQVVADIEKKMKIDPTRGGYAIDTKIRAARPFTDKKGRSGIAVPVVVHYRTVYGNPYTKG